MDVKRRDGKSVREREGDRGTWHANGCVYLLLSLDERERERERERDSEEVRKHECDSESEFILRK